MNTDSQKVEFALKEKVQSWLSQFSSEAPVIVVPVFSTYEDALECIDSLLVATSAEVPLLIVEEASSDQRLAVILEPLSKQRGFFYLTLPHRIIKRVNLAFEWTAPRDVVVVSNQVVVPSDWLERLQDAAYSRSTVATATPFSNNGAFLSVPYRNTPIPNLARGMTTKQVDASIQQASLKLRPPIPTALNYCVYYRREALDIMGYLDETFSQETLNIVGHLDETFSLGLGEVIDFSQRAIGIGFSHVLADDLFVFHKLSTGATGQNSGKASSEIIELRYPWYKAWLAESSKDTRSPLALALERARSALLGYKIAIDGTALDGFTTGAQVLVLELIRALVALPTPRKHLTVIIRDDVPEKALLGITQLVDEVVRVSELENLEEPRFDLIHRPYQVYSPEALTLLQRSASRFIVSHLDFINFSNPTYFSKPQDWSYFQDLTRLTFAKADGIAFISQDAVQDALQNGLVVPPERVCVTYVGVDHHLHQATTTPPAESTKFADQPFIMIIGHNLKHKNRAYALKLFKSLLEQYQWPGHMVLVGPDVVAGGSGGDEALLRLRHPELQERLHYLGAVSEAEKQWLMQKAALILYPSIAEGFGLVPFEAAAVGKPALTTRSTSLGEILGEDVVYLNLLDPKADAEIAWRLISNPQAATRQVEAINTRAKAFTWESVAIKTWKFYEQVLGELPRSQGISPETGMPQYGSKKRTENLHQEYQRLEKWATELSQRLVAIEGKPLYRLLSKLRLL
ncbi:MAG: glycosyltransferase [Chloroflexota bacterium]|nr:glycosyltransferase [Chloroflexota bacterium]